MTKTEIEDKLVQLRFQKAKLEKELEDRENLEKGIMLKNNPRPMSFRGADIIRSELNSVLDEIDSCEKALDIDKTTTETKAKGDLKQRVLQWAKDEKLVAGKTVSSNKIEKLVRDLNKDGYNTTAGAVRTILSRDGYSEERKDRDAS
jgi:hypothetical protein